MSVLDILVSLTNLADLPYLNSSVAVLQSVSRETKEKVQPVQIQNHSSSSPFINTIISVKVKKALPSLGNLKVWTGWSVSPKVIISFIPNVAMREIIGLLKLEFIVKLWWNSACRCSQFNYLGGAW